MGFLAPLPILGLSEASTPAPPVTPAAPAVRISPAGTIYELWLTTDAGVRLALLDHSLGFTASRVVNGIGWLNHSLPASFDTSLIDVDRMVQVWRAPAGGSLSLWRVYFVRKWRFETMGSQEALSISGPDCNDLLRRRIVVGYAGSSYASKTGAADDVMKALVSEAISDTPTPVPSAGTRVWSNLSVAADLGAGPTLTKSLNFGHLLQKSGGGSLADIGKAAREAGTEVFFDIVPAVVSGSSITFQFRTTTGQPGMDVSARVVFDQARGNLVNPFLEYDYSEETDYVYAGGQGEGAARNIQQVYDASRYGKSQWNRCEAFADARNETADNGVREAGRALLEEGRPRRRLGGIPVDTAGTRFGRDWNFGDRVRARYHNEEFDAIIRAVMISQDDDGEQVQARLEWEG